jgi:hypothetical protein
MHTHEGTKPLARNDRQKCESQNPIEKMCDREAMPEQRSMNIQHKAT